MILDKQRFFLVKTGFYIIYCYHILSKLCYSNIIQPSVPCLLSEMPNQTVIVIGAGPVGLFTALLLAQNGIKVTVIEADEGISRSPRAAV